MRLSVEFEVEDDDPKAERLGVEVIRSETDAFSSAVRQRLVESGAEITGFRADYEYQQEPGTPDAR